MAQEIPKIISVSELLIRFVFKSDFKRKVISPNKINFGNFFQPYNNGVSIQRELFCDENESKARAKTMSKVYVGFYIFTKGDFDKLKESYLSSRKDFEADIFATPIDENNNYIALPIESSFFQAVEGNPSHADIIYLNPDVLKGETPKTAIRSFVKKLYQKSNLIIDTSPSEIKYSSEKFNSVVGLISKEK